MKVTNSNARNFWQPVDRIPPNRYKRATPPPKKHVALLIQHRISKDIVY